MPQTASIRVVIATIGIGLATSIVGNGVLAQDEGETRQATEPAQVLLPPTPEGWRFERIELPPEFAPDLELTGFEELRFSPGMFDPDSDSYFTYIFALRIEEDVEIDKAFVTAFLDKYYRGLCKAVAESRELAIDLDSISVEVAEHENHFGASVDMIDVFVTAKPLTLNLELRSVATTKAIEFFAVASPMPRDAPVWKTLERLTAQWQAMHEPTKP